MKPIIEDIQKTMTGAAPILNHHFSTASALHQLSEFFFETGMKLRKTGTEEQRKKYRELTSAYAVVRGAVAQNFMHEFEIVAHVYNKHIYQEEINRLKKELEAAQKAFDELDNF